MPALVLSALVAGAATTATLTTAEAASPPGKPGNAVPKNLDEVKEDIRAYYGDHVDASGQHQASPDSAWAHDVEQVVARAQSNLEQRVRDHTDRPAIVLDIHDTSLLTYPYGANNDFAMHDSAKTGAFLLAESLPVIPPTLALAKSAKEHGVALFFITGSPPTTRDATIRNLQKAGYPAADDVFFMPDPAAVPSYLNCNGACTTVEYKSGTRAHIESLGYDVIVNVGDQQSDLDGGHADATFKLPNPMYVTPPDSH